ncbi:hypothetical protein BRADI_5g01397v3 [Brachypodium distachyon]|uniref:Cytochrome P450 n=1 Tax=Brachypodium distachyon TaxID=15368 RepID=A0A0Q3KNT3_BRADI|nr:hypothetical protein BRADI_5g01397v3 [Brachypodium distachyon]
MESASLTLAAAFCMCLLAISVTILRATVGRRGRDAPAILRRQRIITIGDAAVAHRALVKKKNASGFWNRPSVLFPVAVVTGPRRRRSDNINSAPYGPLWDIGRDPKAWTDPDEFRPERFLAGGDGEGVGPLPGPKETTVRMMPFGAGPRYCPGMGLGILQARCFLAALVREFEWAEEGGCGGVDLAERDGVFKVMRKPLRARITRAAKPA